MGEEIKPKENSDLSRKEKRLLEKQKLKDMGFGKKLEYIWMYYKPAIFGVILCIILFFVGMDLYQNAKKKTILSVTVVNAGEFDADALGRDIKEILGSEDSYDQVDIGINLMTGEEEGSFDYYTQMSYITQLQTQTLDVMVIPEALYETLKESDVFANLHDILSEEEYEAFGDSIQTDHILLENGELKSTLNVSYEPLCITVMVNSKHTEAAAVWLASLS